MADLTLDAQVAKPIDPWAAMAAKLDAAIGREPTQAEALADQVVRVWIAEQRLAIARAEWHLEQSAGKRGKRITNADHHADMIESWEGQLREARRDLRELQNVGNAPRNHTGD